MGAGQFLRDFRRDYHLKKALAHRKSLMLRQERVREKEKKVLLAQIARDRSKKKRSSHIRLLALVNDMKERIETLYKKAELEVLCDAYGVKYVKSWNKTRLAKELIQKIPACDNIPYHQLTSNYLVETVETEATDKVPVLRLRRI